MVIVFCWELVLFSYTPCFSFLSLHLPFFASLSWRLACTLLHFSRVRLFATPWTVARQDPVPEILLARTLKWVAMPPSKGSSWPRDGTRVSCISCIGRWVLYYCGNWEASVILVIFKVLLASWLKVVLKENPVFLLFVWNHLICSIISSPLWSWCIF